MQLLVVAQLLVVLRKSSGLPRAHADPVGTAGELKTGRSRGLLQLHSTHLTTQLNNDSTWVQRIEARHQACSNLALHYWDWTELRCSEPLGGLSMGLWCGGPGLMPEVTILVAVATVLMVLGLGLFLAGVYRFRARPPGPGYTPLPGDNYPAGNGVPIPVHISEGRITPSLTLCVPPFPRQHLRTPRWTPPDTGGSQLAPSQTRCCGADNKDAPQPSLVSLQCSGDRAEAHILLRCLTKRSGWVGDMAWDPKGPSVPWGASSIALLAGREKGWSRSARPAAASPRALRASVGTAADEGRETVREPPREGYEDGEGSAGQGV
ncbi:uncharacterized protein [Anas acuta]|uniref:uncharacterized protein n=1 Tax=Anas acuta TaxID=28680 RepID=UPI0035C8CAEF